MKVIIVDENENVKIKFWGDFVCNHNLQTGIFEITGTSGTILYCKPVKCVFEDELTKIIKVQEK